MIKTPADYLNLFLIQGIVFSDDWVQSSIQALRHFGTPNSGIATYLKKYATFLIDFCIQDVSFKWFSSKVIAAASIEISWKIVGVFPHWNKEFENIFHLSYDEISDASTKMY